MDRSEYLGVYHNTNAGTQVEVPFRAAIRRGHGPTAKWINLGYCSSERVAARIYNMYAIMFFGKGAILNNVSLNQQELDEYQDFINTKEKRIATQEKSRDKAYTLLGDGHVFRQHTELQRTAQGELPM